MGDLQHHSDDKERSQDVIRDALDIVERLRPAFWYVQFHLEFRSTAPAESRGHDVAGLAYTL